MQTYFAQGGENVGLSQVTCAILLFTFSLQHDDAAKQCQDLSQELVNLRGELGK